MQSNWLPLSIMLLLLVPGCRSTESLEQAEPIPARHIYRIGPAPGDSESYAWLQTYRDNMEADHYSVPVARLMSDLEGGGPESPLWNLMSDLFRYRATLIAETFVHVALLDPERFQSDLEPGPITQGDLYHFYPAPDPVTVLGITRDQVDELAHQIARSGPLPMSGLRMVISGDRAYNVVLDYSDLNRDGLYHVAVPTHLLASGRYPVLQEAETRSQFDVRVRDLIAAHMKTYRSLEAYRDLRLRITPEQECEDGQEALASRCL
ncbi:MAG: 5'-nucleotidase C-terminal domain-containing protein [Balneolaceae bacterium]